MIENIERMQQEHISCAKALCERLMSQYQAQRSHYMETLQIMGSRNFTPFVGCERTPPSMEEGALNNAVFKACLLGTREYFMKEGPESSSKHILLQGFFPSFFLSDLLGNTKINHHIWDKSNSLELGFEYDAAKAHVEKLVPREQFPTTFGAYVKHLSEVEKMRGHFYLQNKTQDEEYGDGVGRQNDHLIKQYLRYLYNKAEVDLESLEKELSQSIQDKTQEASKTWDLVAGGSLGQVAIVSSADGEASPTTDLEETVVVKGDELKQRLEKMHQQHEQEPNNGSSPLYVLP